MACHGVSAITVTLLLALATSVQGTFNCTGSWKSLHGSIIKLSVAQDGFINGSYQSSSTDPLSSLTGYQQQGDQPTIALSVKRSTSASTTAFIGQIYITAPGDVTMKTLWILKEAIGNITDDWKTSRIGCTDFWRI